MYSVKKTKTNISNYDKSSGTNQLTCRLDIVGDNCRVIKNTISIEFPLTCVGFQVFRGDHDYKSDGPFIAEHLVGPATDGAHAFDRSYAIVGY